MAGIGFSLRRLMKDDSYFGLLRAYGFAGIISSGPWVLSIVGILIIGLFTAADPTPLPFVSQFQVSVTYLMAFSLILTSPLQLMFTRYIADRLYEKHREYILPNLIGALFVTIAVSGILGSVAVTGLFSASWAYRILMLAGFVILCALWIVLVFLSGQKSYITILLSFLAGYGITIGAAYELKAYELEGLLAGFVAGHAVLLFTLLYVVLRSFSAAAQQFIAFDFLNKNRIYPSLAVTGFLYTFSLWVDKFIFWFSPYTGMPIIPPLRASVIYDLPIFLAYLSIIPGMAVFLIRMETDFAEQYEKFYQAINEGGSLKRIKQIHLDMTQVIHRAMQDMMKVQGLIVLVFILLGKEFLVWFGISPYYSMLLSIDVLAVGVQLLLMAILNLFFYFDYRKSALYLCLLFLVSNIIFTLISTRLGPAYYGFGFAIATIITTLTGFFIISRRLDHLIYETFMLRTCAASAASVERP